MLIVFLLCFQVKPVAQVTVYQYRQVPDDKIEDFIFRETTYWSKVAEKALEKGNLSFWGIFQKVGGYDLPNSSNFLFVNTFPDIDAVYRGEVFDAAAVFPGTREETRKNGCSRYSNQPACIPEHQLFSCRL